MTRRPLSGGRRSCRPAFELSPGALLLLVLRAVCFALFAAMAIYAGHLAAEDSRYRAVLGVAERLEFGKGVSSDITKALANVVLDPSYATDCRSDLLRPALTIVMVHLNATNSARDYQGWATAHRDAEKFLARMIRCLPADGNAWLREALVSRAIAEDADGLKQKLVVARRLMPYEAPQVRARLSLWKTLSPYALSASENLARADIRATLVYGRADLKRFLTENMSPQFAALVRSESQNLTSG